MMYKIFINGVKLILSSKKIKNINSLKFKDPSQVIFLVINMMNNEIKETQCLYSKNVSLLFQVFLDNFTFIRSAGGVVFNNDKSLWIYRNRIWDLPKGGIEDGESLEDAAIREVQEECGIKEVFLDNFLGSSLHMYKEKNEIILKEVIWYRMKTKQIELTPQTEEGITKVEWKTKEEHNNIVENNLSHSSIIDFLTCTPIFI